MSDSESESEKEKNHRTKKSVVVKFQFEDSSSAGSDSDEAGPSNRIQRPTRIKKTIQATSDDCSSDSDAPLNLMQRKMGKKFKAQNCIDESDESTDDSWSPVKNQPSTSSSMPHKTESVKQSTLSESSDTDSSCDLMEKCPICLHAFRDQEIGTPNVCDHSFCAPCIDEWSSNVQTCPIDRKPFTTIRIRSRYDDGVFVREDAVMAKTAETKENEMDVTHCEICNQSDREDIMLLCDGCDAGYHMDCLIPPLTEIPDGSWYCDNCFASEVTDDDIPDVLAEMESFVAPTTRLRVREEVVPRITRTRQSERIRTTIRNRRQENHVNVESVWDLSMPGPSRSTETITTTTTTVTSTTTKKGKSKVVKKKVQKRRRKVQRRRRTYVVEYDVDEYNNKFGIKTAKRVIKKRRRKTKKSRKKSGVKCSRRNQGQDSQNVVDTILSGSLTKGLRKEYPKLHLFGNKNALDYFSGNSDDDEGIGSLNNSIETGDGLLIMSRARPNIHRNLIRRKHVGINSTMGTGDSEGGTDILSNIMDTMNRWHSMSRPSTIEKIKINADGSLECGQKSNETSHNTEQQQQQQPNADILNAPMNPRNDGGSNRSFNNSNGYRTNNTNQNTGHYSQNQFGDRNEQTSFSSFQRAANFGDGGGGAITNNFQQDNLSPRNRLPFQRQRNTNQRLLRNQFQPQPQPQGLYDGEDIPPIPDMPTQSDNDLSSRLKNAQPDSDGIVQADQNLPLTQPASNQSPDCESNNIQDANNVQSTSEVSSSHDQPVSTTSGVYSDSDEDDAPVFKYSAESMQVVKDDKEDSPDSTPNKIEQSVDDNMENDEDLVQLDDDENFGNETGISEDQANQTQLETAESIESPVASPETTGTESPKTPPLNNECESNEPTMGKDKEMDDISESEDQPVDKSEVQPNADDAQAKTSNDKNENSNLGIEGMDTEMISEDEHDLHDDQVSKELEADKENNNRKSDRDDSFKKVSKNNKERNYRDKKETKRPNKTKSRRSRSRSSFSRSKSRSSRSRSPRRNRGSDRRSRRKDNRDKNREKRQEMQRYDVRVMMADRQPRSAKDRYGRDTSRPPRSITPRRGKSRSISRSISPSHQSARRRSPSRHRSHSRRRRSPSRRSASLRRRRSVSRNRYYTSSKSRSNSRGRIINGQSSKSKSRSRSYSPRPAHSGMYHMHSAYSRSRSRDKKSKKKSNDKKTLKYRAKKKVTGPKKVSPFHSPNRRDFSPGDRRRLSRSKSWNDRGSWNRSMSDVPNEAELSWTPPIAHAPENLTVILKNKDNKRKRDKRRKTEKRKTELIQRKEKRKRTEKQNSPALPSKEVFASGDNILVSVSFNKDKPQQQQQTTIVTLPPTKEQLLNKNKPRERDVNSKRSRRNGRDVPRKHRKVDIKPVAIIDLDNSPFKEVTPSPRAVIILSDSDHESDKLNKTSSLNYSMTSNATESISNDKHHSSIDARETNIRVSSPPQSPTTESASFELPLGPKTPPEPSHLVKFSISTSTKTKIVRTVVNPLHDDNDDDDEEEDANSENKETNNENVISTTDKVQISSVQAQQKVGPNTPPGGPCSPDVYDPFEPTKSASQSPTDSIHDTVDEAPTSATDDGKSTKSVDLSMALINSKASMDAANSLLSSTLGGEDMETALPNDESNVSPYKDKPIDDGFRESAATKSSGIHVFSNVLLTPAKDSSRLQPQPSQSRTSNLTITNLSNSASVSKQSPLKYTSGSIISKLPLPKIAKPQRHNGNDDNMDIESPYSPGSSDYEDWFEPPPNSPPTHTGGKHGSRQTTKSSGGGGGGGATTSTNKGEIFDDLFGSTSPITKNKAATKRRPSKHSSSIKVSKHSTQMGGYTKLNEEQLRILDLDVPSSAVELQAKDKFLRKLNRQERVIEEVKLVLKPHYNKKHITKDEYKEIMRRAVPKICHNRTGEINPKKIKKLIEAYVGKFRQKRKLQQSTNVVIK
ncbi:PHD and RING finger domain-containing protein 1 isoform X2 [Contarinia nasturtii]|uniref:PHD and RING finger domain-containing protein 1 isoform X2 n=1 Tax=Contarinia nasturtii TaxID=265458 RepID=UPI0012D3C75A|nr:PHD and RING finger domain-containing protein 1 isoform X2 [Contarinia nasturtii]